MPTPDFSQFEAELARLAAKFGQEFEAVSAPRYPEARLRDDYLNPFFRALGWDLENAAALIQSRREVEIESRTDIAGRAKRVDYLFRTDASDRFVCEAKKPFSRLGSPEAFQAKRYAFNMGLPLAMLSDFEEIKVYVVGGRPHLDRPEEGHWKTWHFRQYPLVAREIWDLFAREKVAAGSVAALLDSLPRRAPAVRGGKARQAYLIKPDRNRALDSDFLEFLDEARHDLASSILQHNPRGEVLADDRLNAATQHILDRLLFIRICEDRDIDTGTRLASIVEIWRRKFDRPGVLPPRQASFLADADADAARPLPPESLWSAVVAHLRALDHRPPGNVPLFNGQLFKPHFSETLLVGDRWLADFIARLSDDESPYLFNIIPVEILGSVYERFLGKVIRPSGRGVKTEEKPEVRKAGGVYYTPRYIVDYIVEQTVGKIVGEIAVAAPKFAALEKRSGAVRLLDPACGSGSFLIRAFERMCEHWLAWLTAHPEDRKKKDCWVDEKTGDVHLTVDLKRRILRDNIFGVDLDPQAVEVTQLSLYLKMLEGETRQTLARERELFGEAVALLPSLDANIKCGNSLIASDFSLVAEDLIRVRAFDWPVQFREVMRVGGFDAVIGNPPYIPIESMEQDERQYYSIAYPQLERKYDTGVAFILAALKRITSTGTVGFISSITWETGENFSKVRQQMFRQYGVKEVVNLPFNTFADAYVDTGIYILTGAPTESYQIHRFAKKAKIDSLKNLQHIVVPTNLVTAPDYRLVLDPIAQRIFLRALEKANFKPLGAISKSTQGLAADRFTRSVTATTDDWYPFGENAHAHRYAFDAGDTTFADMAGAPSLKPFYEAEPKLLVRRIINRQDRLEVCFCDQQLVFKKDINPFILTIAGVSTKFFLGVIGSRLMSYLYVNTSSIATKDDFRQTTLAELRRLPVPVLNLALKTEKTLHTRLVALVDKMLILTPQLRAEMNDAKRAVLENAVAAADHQIDDLVYQLYGLTPEEIALVEAAAP